MQGTNQNEWKFMHDGTKHEIFSVVKFGTSSNPNAAYVLIGTAAATVFKGFAVFYDDRSTSSRNDRIFHQVSNGSSPTIVSHFTPDDYWTPNQFGILSVLSDPGNATAADRSEIRKSGGSLENNNTNTGTPTTDNPTDLIEIGRSQPNNTFPLTGSIAELIVISGANVTTQNRTDIINYLSNKWGISI
jgi:hypothetical protein